MANYTTRLWLKQDRPNKDQTVPIFIVLSINSKRAFYGTGINIYPEQWNDDKGKVVALSTEFAKKYGIRQIDLPGLTDAAKGYNNDIAAAIKKIDNLITRYELDGKNITAKTIMSEFKAEQRPKELLHGNPAKEVLGFMLAWIKEHEPVKKKGSMQVYRTVAGRIADYEDDRKTKVIFTSVTHSFFEDFKIFLETNYSLNSITIAKQLSTLKTFLNKAEKREIAINTNYKAYTIERDTDLEVIALTTNEFELIKNAELSGRFDAVRDVFMFSCCTGLRFSDLQSLQRRHIKTKNVKGEVKHHIDKRAVKVGNLVNIPLSSQARSILAKYEGMPMPLPVLSNQKSNEALHDLCEHLGIDEHTEIVRTVKGQSVTTVYPRYDLITMHTGRKTFATLSLQRGMMVQDVMAIGGWSDFKSFQRYVKFTDEAAQDAMQKVWG